MSRLKMLMILLGVVGITLSWFFIGGIGASAGQKVAAERSIEFVTNEYSIQVDEIAVDTVTYWEEEDRYAVKLKDLSNDKNYDIALRLDDNFEVAFILDVTDQFDEFGLAYCH